MYSEFEKYKQEHPGCGPADKAIFWENKAIDLAETLQWIDDHNHFCNTTY